MRSLVEVIPGWEVIHDRLDNTLSQLNRLMHHYADVPPPDDIGDVDPDKEPGCVSKECLEADIQNILKDTKRKLKDLGFTNGLLGDDRGKQFQEANEESQRVLVDRKRQIFLLKEELARGQHEVNKLHQKMREYQDTLDQFRQQGVPNIKISRELERTKFELLEKAKEFENIQVAKVKIEKEFTDYIKTRQSELIKEKMQKQCKLRELKENFQNEVLTTTQQHMDREIELQEFCQREKKAHLKIVEDMMTLHIEEVKKLKAKHSVKLEECCQNHASFETEWQDKEFELHKQISGAVQEKTRYIQLLFDEHLKVQALEVQLARIHTNLANEKLAKCQVESELKFMKADVSLANEKVKMGLKAQEYTQTNLTSLQEDMINLRRTCAVDVARLEEKAFSLQKNLSCITNTCVKNEHELHSQSRKVEELQKSVNVKQKDLIAATTDIQKLQQEIQCLQSEIKAKEEEKKALQKYYEAQYQQLHTQIFKLQIEEKHKCEDIVLKTNDTLDTQLQRQAQHHKKNVQKFQKQFRVQWEEYAKNSGLKFQRGDV